MGDPHRLIIGEVNAQSTSDLLRAPRRSPASVLTRSVTTPTPAHLRARDDPVRALHFPGKPVLHIASQLLSFIRVNVRFSGGHQVISAAGHEGWSGSWWRWYASRTWRAR